MELSSILILVFFGLVGGLLSGLLGVGGGIIFVPIVTFFLKKMGVDGEELVQYVLANSLATILFAGIVSSLKQYRMKQFYPKQILITASLAIISSFVVTQLIVKSGSYSKTAFGYVFITLLLFTLIRFWLKRNAKPVDIEKAPTYKYLLTGFVTGIITSISGLGGGVIMIPMFTQYIKLDMKKAASISIGVIPLIILPILLTYGSASPIQVIDAGQIGYILPFLVFPIIAGLVFAAPFGVALSHKLSDKILKTIFAALILIVIINTIGNLVL